jgi:hypothetical protein
MTFKELEDLLARGVGAAAGAVQQFNKTSNSPLAPLVNAGTQYARDVAGQVTGGARTFNLVSPVKASDVPPDQVTTSTPSNIGGYPTVDQNNVDNSSSGNGQVKGLATTGTPDNNNDAGLAQSAYDLAQQRIRNLFNQGEQTASNLEASGQRRLSDILAAVDAFKDRAKDQWTNAGQEITNVASDILHGNATNAANLVGKATGQARSLGLGLSSRLNLGQGLMQGLESTQGNTMAKAGEQNRANQVLLDTRNDTGDTTASNAQSTYQDVLDQANALRSTNLANYGTNETQAGQDFASMLNNIVNYNRSLTAMAAPDAASLVAMQPDMSGIVDKVNSVLGGLSSTTTASAGANQPTTLASPLTYVDLLKRQGLYANA